MLFRKIMIIVNRRSGMGRGDKCLKEIVRWKKNIIAGEDVMIDIQLTSANGENSATNLANRSVIEGYDLIIGVGGDGTFNEIANALAGSGVPLGIVKAGNGNDFAKTFGIPNKTLDALSVILTGNIVNIDVGSVNGKIFIDSVGFGLNARIVRWTESFKKKHGYLIPNIGLYTAGFLLSLFSGFKYYKLRMDLFSDKRCFNNIEELATFVSIANVPTSGGLFRLTPAASPEDGLLDICWVKHISRLKIIIFLRKAMKGIHVCLPEILKNSDKRLLQASSITLFSVQGENIPCFADGEILPINNHYYIKTIPRSLKVIIPAEEIRRCQA